MDDARKPQAPIKGRGAASYVHGRYAVTTTHGEDDGWGSVYDRPRRCARARRPPSPRSARAASSAATIRPDIGFAASVNPYRGCEHGCVYCFARPSHAYLDLSPGLDFETKLFAKTNAAERLRAELAKPSYRCTPIALGINTDAYQPIERRYRITRQCLEVLAETRHPLSFITKSALIERDIDLLAAMARERLVNVYFSITTLDNHLAAKMEPRASAPHAQAAGDEGAVRCRRAGRRDGRAGHSDDHRQRTRTHPRGRPRARRPRRRLRAVAPAARTQGNLARVAGAALPRSRRARDEPDPADARRQGLRQHLRQAHARRRPVRAADRSSALPRRMRAWASVACHRSTPAALLHRALLRRRASCCKASCSKGLALRSYRRLHSAVTARR